jgi:hypothetical protein
MNPTENPHFNIIMCTWAHNNLIARMFPKSDLTEICQSVSSWSHPLSAMSDLFIARPGLGKNLGKFRSLILIKNSIIEVTSNRKGHTWLSNGQGRISMFNSSSKTAH